jgi:hypothetical protein
MLIRIGSRGMLRASGQQIKCMRQHRQNRRQGALRSRRATRQIDDQRASKRPAHRTAQRSQRSLPQSLSAHALRQSVDHPFADQSRSLRRHIPRSQPRPPRSHNQTYAGRMTPQRCGNQIQLIGQDLGRHHINSSSIQQLTDRGPGQVDLFPPRAPVAHRQHNGANIGRKARSHVSQSTGFAHVFRNFRSFASTH